MSGLAVKRWMVVIISQALGFLITVAIIGPGFDLLPAISVLQGPQGRSIAVYGGEYFLVTAVPIGIVVMIWMDKFLDTRILPD